MAGDNEPTHGEGGPSQAAYELDWTDPSAMKDDDLGHFIDTQFTAGKERRAHWEQAAAKQLAWLEGDQDRRWDEGMETLERIPQEQIEGVSLQYVHPIRVNKLKPVVEQRMAMVLGSGVELYSRAASTDDEDVSSAVVGTKLLHYLMHSGATPTRRRFIAALWRMFGSSIIWIHVVWDPYAGTPETFKPKTDGTEDDDQRREVIERFREEVAGKLGKQPDEVELDDQGALLMPPGEVYWDFRTGFDITEPEFCSDIDECDWIIDTRWRSMEYLHFRYGEDAIRDLTPSNTAEEYVHDFRRQYGQAGGEQAKRAPAELIQVHSLWRRHRPWSPRGALVISAGKKILHKGPHPYCHGELPFIPLQEMLSESIRPSCTVANLMDLQEARNRRRSMTDAALHMTIGGKILVEEGVVIKEGAFDENDRLVEVPNGAISNNRLKPMQQPKLPYEVFPMDALDGQDIADVANVHNPTSGRSEFKGQSGRHAALMQQADVRGNTVALELIRAGLSSAGRHSLMLWHEFVTAERTVVITGGDLEGEVFTFQAKDLAGKGQQTKPGAAGGAADFNVEVKIGPQRDLAETLALIDTMVTSKTWDPEKREGDRQKIEQLIGDLLPSDKDEAAAQRRNAQREHARFKADKEVRIRYGDDDPLHVREHERWTTSDEFGKLLERDRNKKPADKIDTTVLKHIIEHQMSAAEKVLRLSMIEAKVKADLQEEQKLGTEELQPAQASVQGPAPPRPGPGGPGAVSPAAPRLVPAVA